MKKIFLKISSIIVLGCFFFHSATRDVLLWAQASPSTIASSQVLFSELLAKGLKLNASTPFDFQLILQQRAGSLSEDELKQETAKLSKYFLAALTVPDNDFWVNLSPSEPDRMVPKLFGQTAMGADLLAQDYVLKQLASSLLSLDNPLGKRFWDQIYQKVYEKYGPVDIPVGVMGKVWIVPERAVVYENGLTAVIAEASLDIKTAIDYEGAPQSAEQSSNISPEVLKLAAESMREIILPEIKKQINESQDFAPLRQIYYALILATWFKHNIKESFLSSTYGGQNRTQGLDRKDQKGSQEVYKQYLDAFQHGAYDVIREDYDPAAREIITRKYFTGGALLTDVAHQGYQEVKQWESVGDLSNAMLADIHLDVADKAPSEDFDQASLVSFADLLRSFGRPDQISSQELPDRFLKEGNDYLHVAQEVWRDIGRIVADIQGRGYVFQRHHIGDIGLDGNFDLRVFKAETLGSGYAADDYFLYTGLFEAFQGLDRFYAEVDSESKLFPNRWILADALIDGYFSHILSEKDLLSLEHQTRIFASPFYVEHLEVDFTGEDSFGSTGLGLRIYQRLTQELETRVRNDYQLPLKDFGIESLADSNPTLIKTYQRLSSDSRSGTDKQELAASYLVYEVLWNKDKLVRRQALRILGNSVEDDSYVQKLFFHESQKRLEYKILHSDFDQELVELLLPFFEFEDTDATGQEIIDSLIQDVLWPQFVRLLYTAEAWGIQFKGVDKNKFGYNMKSGAKYKFFDVFPLGHNYEGRLQTAFPDFKDFSYAARPNKPEALADLIREQDGIDDTLKELMSLRQMILLLARMRMHPDDFSKSDYFVPKNLLAILNEAADQHPFEAAQALSVSTADWLMTQDTLESVLRRYLDELPEGYTLKADMDGIGHKEKITVQSVDMDKMDGQSLVRLYQLEGILSLYHGQVIYPQSDDEEQGLIQIIIPFTDRNVSDFEQMRKDFRDVRRILKEDGADRKFDPQKPLNEIELEQMQSQRLTIQDIFDKHQNNYSAIPGEQDFYDKYARLTDHLIQKKFSALLRPVLFGGRVTMVNHFARTGQFMDWVESDLYPQIIPMDFNGALLSRNPHSSNAYTLSADDLPPGRVEVIGAYDDLRRSADLDAGLKENFEVLEYGGLYVGIFPTDVFDYKEIEFEEDDFVLMPAALSGYPREFFKIDRRALKQALDLEQANFDVMKKSVQRELDIVKTNPASSYPGGFSSKEQIKMLEMMLEEITALERADQELRMVLEDQQAFHDDFYGHKVIRDEAFLRRQKTRFEELEKNLQRLLNKNSFRKVAVNDLFPERLRAHLKNMNFDILGLEKVTVQTDPLELSDIPGDIPSNHNVLTFLDAQVTSRYSSSVPRGKVVLERSFHQVVLRKSNSRYLSKKEEYAAVSRQTAGDAKNVLQAIGETPEGKLSFPLEDQFREDWVTSYSRLTGEDRIFINDDTETLIFQRGDIQQLLVVWEQDLTVKKAEAGKLFEKTHGKNLLGILKTKASSPKSEIDRIANALRQQSGSAFDLSQSMRRPALERNPGASLDSSGLSGKELEEAKRNVRNILKSRIELEGLERNIKILKVLLNTAGGEDWGGVQRSEIKSFLATLQSAASKKNISLGKLTHSQVVEQVIQLSLKKEFNVLNVEMLGDSLFHLDYKSADAAMLKGNGRGLVENGGVDFRESVMNIRETGEGFYLNQQKWVEEFSGKTSINLIPVVRSISLVSDVGSMISQNISVSP